ncbi:hypothetical protein KFE25_000057 [Diacronema lutheri]|uniref:Inosine/uridine-preferring nucleoside hydrolase domain-containing protein n=1 Tax=Diacronema lutheri TaxID=2081491 RepID=A0A8J5XG27_DIALT|nr:hypothetical protein KFE25_000057 [Diacronema lutheri]
MRRSQRARALGFVLVTDPGPDPDDIKALLVAAVLHRHGRIVLRAVIANGGQQADLRAKLARCVLDHVGVLDVPVGIGSAGSEYSAQAHEYQLEGFEEVDLARSFAERKSCELLRYLASAQSLGLEGLWQKLCEGKLPPRCSKQWYFETFCGAAPFDESGVDDFDESVDIIQQLNGFVKPYDVLALMAALPLTSELFACRCELFIVRGTTHRLLLRAEHMIPGEHVHRLLRETYHEVVLNSMDVRQAAMAFGADGARPPQPGRDPSNSPNSTQRHPLQLLRGGRGLSAGGAALAEVRHARMAITRSARRSAPGAPGRRPSPPPSPVAAAHANASGDRRAGWHEAGSDVEDVLSLSARMLRLRAANSPGLFSFTDTTDTTSTDARVGGQSAACSADFDRTMEADIVNRLHKALDEAREQHVKVVSTTRAVASALALSALAALILDVAHALGVPPPVALVPFGAAATPSSAESLAWRHAACVLLLLLTMPLLILTVQPRQSHLLQSRLAVVSALLVALLALAASVARMTAERDIAAQLDAHLGGTGAARAVDGGGAGRAGRATVGADRASARCVASALLADAPSPLGSRLGTAVLALTWTAHCGRVHALDAALLSLSSARLLWRCARHWHHGPRLLDATWAAIGVTSVVVGVTTLCCRSAILGAIRPCARGGTRAPSAAHLSAFVAEGLLAIALGVALSWPASRRRLQAAVARATGNVGTYAPLAPLIGYGCVSSGEIEPEELYAEAMRTFAPVELDAGLRACLGESLTPRSWAERRAAPRSALAAARARDDRAAGADQRGSAARGARGEPVGATSRSGEHAPCAVSGESAIADYYVCHSWDDDCEWKVRALRAWGERRERELGRAPTLWLDALQAGKGPADTAGAAGALDEVGAEQR